MAWGQVQGLALGLGAVLLAGCQTVPNNLQAAANQQPSLEAPSVSSTELVSSTSMPDGKPTEAAPPGFISFCYRFADQCVASSKDASAVHLDVASQAVI